MILALLASVGAIAVAFVLYPVFTAAPATGGRELDESEFALVDLNDQKTMLYETIQELDFEKAAGKISVTDYEAARNDYLAQVSALMEKMDTLAPQEKKPPTESKTKKPIKPGKKAGKHKQDLGFECESCGEHNPKGSNFCLECGKAFAVTCASCGGSLPAQARFCNACGEKVTA